MVASFIVLVYRSAMRWLFPALVCVGGLLLVLPARAQDSAPDTLLTQGARCEAMAPCVPETPEVVGLRGLPEPRRLATYALLAFALLSAFFAYDAGARPASPRVTSFRRRLLMLLIVAAFGALLLPALPVHDHNAFVARAECAMDSGCDADRPGWMPPAYHAIGLLLSAFPYRYPLVEYTGLVLTLLTLLVFGLTLARVHRLFGDSIRGRHVALVAVTLGAFHPVALRLAVAGTFWPWADLCLMLSAWLATWAAEHRSQAGWLAAASFFALTLTSNVSFLALAPLALVAPWLWARRPPRARILAPLALLALFVAPYAWMSVHRLGGAAASMPWAQKLVSLPLNLIYLDPRLTPLPLSLLFLLGLVVALRSWRRCLPLLLAFGLTEVLLGSLQDLDTGYPVRLIHGTTSLYFSAWLTAAGAVSLAHWLREHRQVAGRTFFGGLVAVTLLASAFNHEARAFAVGPRVLGPERRAFSHALDRLPDHDLLVVPPSIMRPIAGLSWDGDPLEARYPWGEYRAARQARGLAVPPIVSLPDYLARPDDFRGQSALLYVGASLRSFAPAEVAAGYARPPYARPVLCELLATHRLEPAATFALPTANHPFSLVRLLGDARPTATLGFYWIRPRDAGGP